jgi:hypothetical protein
MAVLSCLSTVSLDDSIDLAKAVVVTRGDKAERAERTAATVLVEEVAKRTGVHWRIGDGWPAHGSKIVVTTAKVDFPWTIEAPAGLQASARELAAEGFRLVVDRQRPDEPVVWVVGADSRGALFGVGQLLRCLEMRQASVRLDRSIDLSTAPMYPIRGHQLGYRDRANSYDAWDEKQYEQYIRELAIFGANAVENIPFEDRAPSPHMKLPRAEMNVRISEICARYELAYWLWTPADFDLNDAPRREQALANHEALYQSCPRLDAIFVPGGDPGDNHPRLVMPFLKELAERLERHHPRAKVWLSLQGFTPESVDSFYKLLGEQDLEWFGGVVAGPSSPPIADTRRRLSKQYALRHYPDITHTVRAQYPVPWWDPAFSMTLGREPINPRPLHEALIHNAFASYTDGFISYSDGVHDDVNKTIWSRLGWDPRTNVREILIEYARFFLGPDVSESAADGLFALERNWDGPLATNGGVSAALSHWQRLESENPQLRDNWRWQQCLLRAYYDAYTRHRLNYETRLEDDANAVLAEATRHGADRTIDAALQILKQAETDRCQPKLRGRIEQLCDALFQSVGLQTSVPRFKASGYERGCVLDFVDHPLNNRWWLEDEFVKIRLLASEHEKLERLELIRTWEHPGVGSFYDDIGNVAKSPHVIRGERQNTDPTMRRNPNTGFMWWDEGRSRRRPSWISYMNWPLGLSYDGLDPNATYVVRLTGLRQSLLRANGARMEPTVDGQEIGEFKEFPVPPHLIRDGKLLLTWDIPDESHLNWRVKSRVTEVWLLKR